MGTPFQARCHPEGHVLCGPKDLWNRRQVHGSFALLRMTGGMELLGKRHKVGCKPLVEKWKAEFAFRDRSNQELEGSLARNIQIESVHQQKRVSRRKSHPFIAIHEGMIIDQRLQQSGRLLAQVVAATRRRAENRRYQGALIDQSALAAIFLNLVMMN